MQKTNVRGVQLHREERIIVFDKPSTWSYKDADFRSRRRRDPAPAVVPVHEAGQAALGMVVAEVLDDVDLASSGARVQAAGGSSRGPVLAAQPMRTRPRRCDAIPEGSAPACRCGR